LIGAFYIYNRLCDTPQSEGLPPIEEYNNDYPEGMEDHEDRERELTMKELLFHYVLTNKYVWLLAFANFFTYIARYSMLDWGPMYLREIKGASLHSGGLAVLAIEFGGIPSTILMGWLSDLSGGRRGMLSVLCLIPVIGAFTIMLFTPASLVSLDMLMLAVIGLFVYPVINFIVIIALDTLGKKAIGTAAGFIGLFGYLGKTAQAKGFGWILDYAGPAWGEHFAWNLVILAIMTCTLLAGVLLAFTWNLKPRS
jgi:OPA family glycerol-3-phosphate transporter-like MFS transporter